MALNTPTFATFADWTPEIVAVEHAHIAPLNASIGPSGENELEAGTKKAPVVEIAADVEEIRRFVQLELFTTKEWLMKESFVKICVGVAQFVDTETCFVSGENINDPTAAAPAWAIVAANRTVKQSSSFFMRCLLLPQAPAAP